MILLTLPKPPSVNSIYRYTSRGGRASSYISKKGKEWFQEAGTIVLQNNPYDKPIPEIVNIGIKLYTARMQDIDNVIKPTLDLLSNFCLKCQGKYSLRKDCSCGENHSMIVDDRQVVKLIVDKIKVPHLPEERLEVRVVPIDKN